MGQWDNGTNSFSSDNYSRNYLLNIIYYNILYLILYYSTSVLNETNHFHFLSLCPMSHLNCYGSFVLP